MSIDRVAVTGGNGKIGERILSGFNDHGYETVDVARGKRREEVSDEYRTTDLLDPGEVYGSLAASDADAVVHMGTIPSPVSHPEHVTFESNVMTTYHVAEAATALGLEAVVFASSINAIGADYQEEPADVRYLPVDEEHPVTPRDPYGLGKHAAEVVGDGFGRRSGTPQMASLRYPWVATDEELRRRFGAADRSLDAFASSGGRTGNTLFTYLHMEDAVSVARRAVEADFEGHEVFWTVAADTSVETPTPRLVEEFYADAEVREPLEGHDSLISVEKARDLLDWEPEHSWRDA
ncbi:MAG: NAD-dependent epimerase/dehydratase family protein [Haloarculaceae archaeon]